MSAIPINSEEYREMQLQEAVFLCDTKTLSIFTEINEKKNIREKRNRQINIL